MSEFSGSTFSETKDRSRLAAQQQLVGELMSNGAWWTLEELRQALVDRGVPAVLTGVSARVRCLRKPEWGSHEIEHRRRSAGLWEYRMVS